MPMKQVTVKVRTLSPLVLTTGADGTLLTETGEVLTGTVLRGLLAARYIRTQQLGNAAHEDAGFRRAFFGTLRFVTAFPVVRGRLAQPVPFCLQKEKDGTQLNNLLYQEGKTGYKGMSGLITWDGLTISPVTLKKEMRLHMSRGSKAEERLAGRSTTGGIYNYEAIEAGTEFLGTVYGPEEDLRALLAALGETSFYAHIGRSRFTQYGRVQVLLGAVEEIPDRPPEPRSGEVALCFVTPFLPTREVPFDAALALQEVAAWMNERAATGLFSVCAAPRAIYAKIAEVENFVGVWGMRRPREAALAPGTTFLLRKEKGWTKKDTQLLCQLLREGVGRRLPEGFGQLRVLPQGALLYQEAAGETALSRQAVHSAETRRRAKRILRTAIERQIEVFAVQDAAEARQDFPAEARHFFSRLASVLGAGERAKQSAFAQNVTLECISDATPFARSLRMVRVAGKSLQYYFLEAAGKKDMPYATAERLKTLEADGLSEVLSDLEVRDGIRGFLQDEAFFAAYWQAFFRFARKIAQGKEEVA